MDTETHRIESLLKNIFEGFEHLGLVYFFGSRATGDFGPLSDYDFGVYFTTKDKSEISRCRLLLFTEISRALKSDSIDIVVLNIAESPELKYSIIAEGVVIFEREPFRVLIEPQILNEYFDFKESLKRYGLTKAL